MQFTAHSAVFSSQTRKLTSGIDALQLASAGDNDITVATGTRRAWPQPIDTSCNRSTLHPSAPMCCVVHCEAQLFDGSPLQGIAQTKPNQAQVNKCRQRNAQQRRPPRNNTTPRSCHGGEGGPKARNAQKQPGLLSPSRPQLLLFFLLFIPISLLYFHTTYIIP